MKKKITSLAAICLLANVSFSQFIVKETFFETTGVSNTGEVAGYETWAGPYSIWTPETGNIQIINGLAPGNGIGGRATFSNDGNLLSGTSQGTVGSEMSIYNRSTDTWTTLGSFGYQLDNNFSNAFAISGDGLTITGNAWMEINGAIGFTHAVAWNQTEGVMNLGSMFEGKSTRANAISTDGSVIVGWQDFNGPWKSAVWKKNPAGAYFQNEYILLDPTGSATDEFNQMGECTAVSGDGNWIGGAGDYANNNHAWIWSEATGVIDLGTINESTGKAYVAAINNDGTVAVGRIKGGMWDADIPFIWTPTGGMQDLNVYASTTLGFDLGTKQIYSANCMSPNGDYIAGYGTDNATFQSFAYRLSAQNLGLDKLSDNQIIISPNPAHNFVKIVSEGSAEIIIRNLEGKIFYTNSIIDATQIDISDFENGIYFITVNSENVQKTSKLVKY